MKSPKINGIQFDQTINWLFTEKAVQDFEMEISAVVYAYFLIYQNADKPHRLSIP